LASELPEIKPLAGDISNPLDARLPGRHRLDQSRASQIIWQNAGGVSSPQTSGLVPFQLTAADREVLKATGDDEAAIVKRIGIARAEAVGANYQEALQYPSLNVRGMAAASVGARAANIIPSEAVAESRCKGVGNLKVTNCDLKI
jgi:hypothetical protein